MSSLALGSPGSRRSNGALVAAALLVAAAVGALATVDAATAVALVAAGAVVLAVAADVRVLPVLLVATMFVESLELGPGLRVGRVAGAMAIGVLLYVLLTRGRGGLRTNALLVAVGAYGLWMIASGLWADQSALVFSTLSSYVLAVAYMLSFALIVRTPRQLGLVFATLAVGSLVFGLVSFVTFAASAGGERSSGLQGDPNYFAVYQVISLPAALALASTQRRPGVRLLLYGVVVVIVLSVVSSLSRTGLVALTATVLATLLLPWRVFFRTAAQKTAYVVSLGIAAAFALVIGSTAFVSRIQTLLEPGAGGDRGSGRTDLWKAAIAGWEERPVIGLGAGNFPARSLELLQTTPGVDITRNYVAEGRLAHSAYLGTLAELGLVGLALFLLVLVATGTLLVRAARRASARGEATLVSFATATFVALIGYALSAVFLSNELGKALWILVGLALAIDVVSRRTSAAPTLARVPEESWGADYDPAVQERIGEELEARVAERLDALLAEQERLDRRRAGLAVREQELRARSRAVEERERTASELVAHAEPKLAGAQEGLAELEVRAAALEAREAALAERSAQLDARARVIKALEPGAEADRAFEELARSQAELEARLTDRLAALAASLERLERDDAAGRPVPEVAELERALVEQVARVADEREGEREELRRLREQLAERERGLAELEVRLAERARVLEHGAGEAADAVADRLAGELERLEERRRAVEAAEARLAEREQAEDSAEPEEQEQLEERRRAVEAVEAKLALRERELAAERARIEQLVATREQESAAAAEALAERERGLEQRAAALEARERELAAAAAEATASDERRAAEARAQAVAPVPAEAPAAAPAVEPIAAEDEAAWTLPELERLVADLGPEQGARRDELDYYLLYLREYAGSDGRLPRSFETLLDEVFGELIDAGSSR